MSVQNKNTITNRMGGDGGTGIYTESSTPQYDLGEKLEFKDGRTFRYAKASDAAIAAGNIVSQDQSTTSLVETDDIIIAAAGRFSISAGSLALQITLASIAKDQFAGGMFQVTDDAGEGYQYRIKSNSATAFTTAGKVDIDFYDPIKVAVTTSSDIAIVGGLWNGVMAAVAATDTVVSGVTPIAVTASYYFWAQTAGIALILADGTITIGDKLVVSDGVAGAVQTQDVYTEAAIGSACYAPDTTGHVGVHLYGITA
jgi:hypothetical protein|tara:strand:- start:57 stop:824 length:768 start_codon:yes stop_codon:yes gene_type:complete